MFLRFFLSLMSTVVFPKSPCPKHCPVYHNLQGSGGQYGPTGSMLDRSAVTTGVFSSLLSAESQLSRCYLCQCCRVSDVQLLLILFCFVQRAPIEIFFFSLILKKLTTTAAGVHWLPLFIFYSAALPRTWTVQYPRQLLHCIVKPQHITVLQQYFKSFQYSKGTILFIQSVLHGTTISFVNIQVNIPEEFILVRAVNLQSPFDCVSTHQHCFCTKFVPVRAPSSSSVALSQR